MIAVHSFRSDKVRPWLEAVGGAAMIKPMVQIMSLSASTIAKHYDKFVLITDDAGKRLAEACEMPYSEILSVGESFDSDPCFWVHSKIHAYATVDEPFIHFDTDMFLWDSLPQEFMDSPILGFHTESFGWPKYEEYRENLVAAGMNLPDYHETYWTNHSPINMAMMGGHDVSAIASYAKEILALVDQHGKFYNASDELKLAMDQSMAYIEQALGSYILQSKYGKRVTTLLTERQVINGLTVPGIKLTHLHGAKQRAMSSGDTLTLTLKLQKRLQEINKKVCDAVEEFTAPDVNISNLIAGAQND
jgi:hypothetical protein